MEISIYRPDIKAEIEKIKPDGYNAFFGKYSDLLLALEESGSDIQKLAATSIKELCLYVIELENDLGIYDP